VLPHQPPQPTKPKAFKWVPAGLTSDWTRGSTCIDAVSCTEGCAGCGRLVPACPARDDMLMQAQRCMPGHNSRGLDQAQTHPWLRDGTLQSSSLIRDRISWYRDSCWEDVGHRASRSCGVWVTRRVALVRNHIHWHSASCHAAYGLFFLSFYPGLYLWAQFLPTLAALVCSAQGTGCSHLKLACMAQPRGP